MLTLNVPAHLDLCANASNDGVTTSYTLDRLLRTLFPNLICIPSLVYLQPFHIVKFWNKSTWLSEF